MAGVWRQAFDGSHLSARNVLQERLAGACWLAVDMDRAGAALRDSATEFSAGELQMLPDDPIIWRGAARKVSSDWRSQVMPEDRIASE
jgi:hypothetical protein